MRNSNLGMYNWTAVEGVSPRPYATSVLYFCPVDGWAFPSTGLAQATVYCTRDGSWNNTDIIEECQSKLIMPE